MKRLIHRGQLALSVQVCEMAYHTPWTGGSYHLLTVCETAYHTRGQAVLTVEGCESGLIHCGQLTVDGV